MTCPCRETVPVAVHVDADLSYTGRERWAVKKIDRCVAPWVSYFQSLDINMRCSCCAHGNGPMEIVLSSGGVIKIAASHRRSA